MIEYYDWAGGREALWRFGPADGPVVVAALPLFEEANRTRTFVVTVLRLLAERGIAGALPDLPGQGESLVPTNRASLSDMQAAYSSAVAALGTVGLHAYSFALRSGALFDADAPLYGRWHLSSQAGNDLIRELGRIAGVGADPDWWCSSDIVEVAGNSVSQSLLSAMIAAKPPENKLGVPLRIGRLSTDAGGADIKFDATPLWRRAEPDNDPSLAALVADDIAAWVRACEA